MRAVLIAGSSSSTALEPEVLAGVDLLVAVDGGAEIAVRWKATPDVLIGDLDSVTADTRQILEGQGVEVVQLPTAKDETDTEAALRLAIARGADDITVYGALGGPRLDHLLGNILLLSASWLAGTVVRLVDERHVVFTARGDVVFRGEPGDLVSLLPLTAEVTEVWTSGLSYPLSGEVLSRSATRSVSNSMRADEARVRHGEGVLLIVHYRGRQ